MRAAPRAAPRARLEQQLHQAVVAALERFMEGSATPPAPLAPAAAPSPDAGYKVTTPWAAALAELAEPRVLALGAAAAVAAACAAVAVLRRARR